MQFSTIASGSAGNCCIVSGGGVSVLIDAGISLRRITNAMSILGVGVQELAAVFITHEHTDHIAALPMLMKHIRVPVFAAPLTASVLRRTLGCPDDYITDFEPGGEILCGGLAITSFHTPHDAAESLGYTISDSEAMFAYVTDVGHVTDEILSAVLGADAAVIESNHDVDMLRYGRYPKNIKARILSRRGHLSNDDCGEFAVRLWQSGARRIVLAHLSKDNNTPVAALRTVGEALMNAGAIPGRDVELLAAPADEIAGPYEVVKCCL